MQAQAVIPGPTRLARGLVRAEHSQRAHALSAPHRQHSSPPSAPSSLSSYGSISPLTFPSLSPGHRAAHTAARSVPPPRLAAARCHGAGGDFQVKHVRGGISGEGLKFGVVVALFNDIVTKPLLNGALETFQRHGVREEDVKVVWVPGSFEIPVVTQKLASSGDYDAVLCIGAVVRGSTTHYDAVANNAASGVLSAGLASGVPCIFGVLTCETMEQAMDRAGGKLGNKGSEVAVTAVEMASLMKLL